MNRVNRIIVIVELVLAIALMPILALMFLSFSPSLADAWSEIARRLIIGPSASSTQAIGIAVAALIFVLAVALLILEIQRPVLSGLRVVQVSEGQVKVTADAIIQRLQNEIQSIPDVTKAKSIVAPAKKELVDLFLQVETTPEVNIPQKTQEIIGAVRQLLEERMGLKLGKVQVQIDHTRAPRGSIRSPKTVGPTVTTS